MKVKNIVRKAVALGGSAAVFAGTITGALAYDLSTYPAKYIVDGKFDGKIVVGEKAATADVLGSIDIAASLQGASVSKVVVPGQAGSVSLSGDNFAVGGGSDKVELREPIGDVADTITESDLAGLKSGQITTAEGTTDYHQYLRLKDQSALQDVTVNYVENDDDKMADYMVVDTALPFLEWEIQFPDGMESKVDAGSLKDLEDRSFNIMGTDFTVVKATLANADDVELTLMGGSVPDTLREGETKTYTINGVDYEVTLVFVSDPASSGNPEVKFSVNGELTQALEEGDTDTLSGGLQIGVRDILVNAREGVASFFIGAQKVVLTDNTATVADDWDGTVEINNENINDGDVTILGQNTSSTKFKITSIKYRVTMDAADGTTAFIPAGHGIKENMKRPDSLISDTLDVKYEGLTNPVAKPFSLKAKSDDRYHLTFTNVQGQTYDVPFLSNKDGTFKFGDQDDELIFVEGAPTEYTIGNDDYFVVTYGGVDSDRAPTNVLRYTDYDATSKTLEFEDLSTGSTVSVPVSNFTGSKGQGNLVIGGHTYDVNVSNTAAAAPNLSVDLNGDGDINGDQVNVTVWGGGIIDLAVDADYADGSVAPIDNTTVGNGLDLMNGSTGTSGRVSMSYTLLAKNFDTSDAGDETLQWNVTQAASNEVDLAVAEGNYVGPLDGATADVDEFQLREKDGDSDHDIGMTDYGTFIDHYSPSDSNKADELTLTIPQSQRFGQVFVTLGSVTATEGSAGTADKVNPIAVGLAVLDRDAPAVGSENLIVVGGPCANTVAAELLGNPANCAEGFEPGKATIQSSEKNGKVAILVAGYESTETLGASRVLAAYKDYALKGTQVEVVVADLKNIKVNSLS